MFVVTILIFLLLMFIYAIYIYNTFISLKIRSEASWSDIDVQLKRRHNLIPALITVVKAYATHEKSTLKSIVEARNSGIKAHGVKEQEVDRKSVV